MINDKLNSRYFHINKRYKRVEYRNGSIYSWPGLKINKVLFDKSYLQDSLTGDRIRYLDAFPLITSVYPLKKE